VSLCRWGGNAGADHFGDINPAINVLAGANPDGCACFRHAMAANVELGNVAPAVRRGGQQPQEGEMLHAAHARPDPRGALHQRVLGRRARDPEFECDSASHVDYHQLGHRVETEDGLVGREVELEQAEVGASDVQAHKVVVAVEAHPTALFGYPVLVGRSAAPGRPLFGAKRAPPAGDSADVVTVGLLLGGAGIAGAHVLARDVAVAGLEIDDRALPARLGNGADFHVVSGNRLLRRWFPHPQSGGWCNHVQT
jgi:hypothetical protein